MDGRMRGTFLHGEIGWSFCVSYSKGQTLAFNRVVNPHTVWLKGRLQFFFSALTFPCSLGACFVCADELVLPDTSPAAVTLRKGKATRPRRSLWPSATPPYSLHEVISTSLNLRLTCARRERVPSAN